MLEDLGHTVIQAGSAREALTTLQNGPLPDIVVIDHAMPGMTGLQLAEAVRVQHTHLPNLLVSGYAD